MDGRETSEDDSFTDDSYDTSEDEHGDWEEKYTSFYLMTCREDLLHAVVEHLKDDRPLVDAWLCACQELPGVRGLEDIKRLHPTALPSWLALKENIGLLLKLSVRAGKHVVLNDDCVEDTEARAAERKAQLERFRRCRFNFEEGFASEGMLCNSPPIPLRVLDYLEAADLLSLSLVCKATHRASHYLFRCEEEFLSKLRKLLLIELAPNDDNAARHRIMRAASLLCGRPEALDVTNRYPSLLPNLVASPDACTQPHAKWDNHSYEHRFGLTELVKARRIAYPGMGVGKRVEILRVDPEGWPDREQEALAQLRLRKSLRILIDCQQSPRWTQDWQEKKILEKIAKVFEAACRH